MILALKSLYWTWVLKMVLKSTEGMSSWTLLPLHPTLPHPMIHRPTKYLLEAWTRQYFHRTVYLSNHVLSLHFQFSSERRKEPVPIQTHLNIFKYCWNCENCEIQSIWFPEKTPIHIGRFFIWLVSGLCPISFRFIWIHRLFSMESGRKRENPGAIKQMCITCICVLFVCFT